MNALLTTLIVLAGLCLIYLVMIAPARKRPDASRLKGWLYAHRGLHDQAGGAPENSLEAFRRAVEAGYGIELDVQLTKDGKLIVHHDGSLKRVCGVDRKICETTYQELCAIPLPDGSRVPLLSEVLALVDGRVPLIVEVKQDGGAIKNAAATLALLRGYAGPYCVESFHPLAVRYFCKNAPHIVRGQLAMGMPYREARIGFGAWLALRALMVNCLGRPHFVAYSVPNDHTVSMWLMKRLFKPLLAAWTIRDQQTLDRALAEYDYPIFEGFTPER